jgi:hypothetical protein
MHIVRSAHVEHTVDTRATSGTRAASASGVGNVTTEAIALGTARD